MLSILFSVLTVLSVLVPILLAVAFMTIIERKVLAAMQRRVGPNAVGVYGVLQPLKLCKRFKINGSYARKHYRYVTSRVTKPSMTMGTTQTNCDYIVLCCSSCLFCRSARYNL